MSAFAAVINWENPQTLLPIAERLRRNLDAWRGDRVEAASCPGAALGISLLAADASRQRDRQPIVDEIQKIALVADCRLDERQSLRAELSLSEDVTDAELLVAGYLQWGDDLPRRLRGDFSCVIWDWGRRRCLAFRDPLGVKPLFYSRFPGGLAVASDVEIIIDAIRPDPVPDDQMVVEHLLWEYASVDRTFWASISRVPGGYRLIEEGSGSNSPERYWKPHGATGSRPRNQVHDEFRHAFLRSVERRLDSAGPVLAHLSGGIDSSLIVCAAAQIGNLGRRDVQLETVSERFPGAAWDEGDFIQEVVSWTGFGALEWNGDDSDFVDLSHPSVIGPGMRAVRTSGSIGDLEIAGRRRARVMLSGEGGDQLGRPAGLKEDFARRRPLAFAVETASRYDLTTAQRLIRARLLFRQLVPLPLRRGLATFRYRRHLPSWLDVRWRTSADDIVSSFYPSDFERSFEHRIQRARWHELTSGRMGMALDHQQLLGARHGVEFRFPFLDQDLVELVVSIPPEHWPREATGARLHRDAMGDILPPRIRERRDKAIFSGAIEQRLKRAAKPLAALFHEGEWLSAKYVRRREAQLLLEGTLRRDGSLDLWRAWHDVRAMATLEAWLRGLFRYAPAEVR